MLTVLIPGGKWGADAILCCALFTLRESPVEYIRSSSESFFRKADYIIGNDKANLDDAYSKKAFGGFKDLLNEFFYRCYISEGAYRALLDIDIYEFDGLIKETYRAPLEHPPYYLNDKTLTSFYEAVELGWKILENRLYYAAANSVT